MALRQDLEMVMFVGNCHMATTTTTNQGIEW
jgi:hypothetical protein